MLRSRPFYDLRRARARQRWSRVHKHLASASSAFSSAGQERRRAFTERRWATIAGPEEFRTPTLARGTSFSSAGSDYLAESRIPETERLLADDNGRSRKCGSKSKSVSFDLEDDDTTSAAKSARGSCRRRRLVVYCQNIQVWGNGAVTWSMELREKRSRAHSSHRCKILVRNDTVYIMLYTLSLYYHTIM